jgi:hypothetical protein
LTDHHDRCVSLILNDFEVDPQTLADEIGYPDVDIVRIGDPVGPRRSAKNRITWRAPMFRDVHWDDAVVGLIDDLGGLETLKPLLARADARAAWVRLNLPLIGSPWQESDGLDHRTLSLLAGLGLSFDVAFFNYDEARQTHSSEREI